ncbi:MAG TPA: GxxExxY protein, partial [Verrucomicrobiae bacterium]|nr:GxxExxY protein [Verrucomicrobiae bacterium]
MAELIYSTETYEIAGSCMEVHRELGKGHSEILYKDALQLELSSRRITFDREVEYTVAYKGV